MSLFFFFRSPLIAHCRKWAMVLDSKSSFCIHTSPNPYTKTHSLLFTFLIVFLIDICLSPGLVGCYLFSFNKTSCQHVILHERNQLTGNICKGFQFECRNQYEYHLFLSLLCFFKIQTLQQRSLSKC